MEGISKNGRVLRPRKSSQSSTRTERVEFSGHRNEAGHHSQADGRAERSYGRRNATGSRYPDRGRSYGEHRSSGEGRSFSEHRGSGEGRSFGGHRTSDEGRSYGEHRSSGEHRGYGEHRSFGEKRSFSGDRSNSPQKSRYGSRKPVHSRNSSFNKVSDEGIDRMISRRPRVEDSEFKESKFPAFQEEVRLNRFIANSGVCSRREADTLIQAGVVTVNGEVVTELGTKVNVLKDEIRFNGERLKGEEKVYIVMNKPKGYVTTASDPHAEKTVMDLLKGCTARVYPVGRLDKATTGVLMFTNDGEIAERLTHPSYDKKKIYQVALDRNLSTEDYEKILSGISLTDGMVSADELEFIDENDHRKLGIEIHSGKNRIVRRIFESLGYSVKALDRVYFAGLTKKGLKKGEWRYLSEGEVNILKMGAYA